MGIFAHVIAMGLRRKPKPTQQPADDTYASMSAAELKDAALSGDTQAEAVLRKRAQKAGK